jgi:hypothetical protein
MLLVAMSRVEDQSMGWSEDRRTVGHKWGTGPTIAEQVSVGVNLAGRKLQAYALDGSGRRGEKAAEGATLNLSVATVWYELAGE